VVGGFQLVRTLEVKCSDSLASGQPKMSSFNADALLIILATAAVAIALLFSLVLSWFNLYILGRPVEMNHAIVVVFGLNTSVKKTWKQRRFPKGPFYRPLYMDD
jgi:predicted Co/Zn/Cd cation transporter (cation efflux family)